MKTENNKKVLRFICDIAVFGICLIIFALFHHVIPFARAISGDASNYMKEPVSFREKFADKFTDGTENISTDSVYKTENVSVEISETEFCGAICHIADIYVSDVTFIKTAFAGGIYGKSISDSTFNMAKENNAALAVSGDYYGIRNRSIVIRNGVIYRTKKAHDVCVLYFDGVMKTYRFSDFDITSEITKGVWQAWDFGPSLIENGVIRKDYADGIKGKNPRAAIGYFEPGHYVLVTIDGRQESSSGLTLPEMADFFNSLGCKEAYNLDGGHSAVMTFFEKYVNSPSKKGGRDISDIIYIPIE